MRLGPALPAEPPGSPGAHCQVSREFTVENGMLGTEGGQHPPRAADVSVSDQRGTSLREEPVPYIREKAQVPRNQSWG